MFGLARSGVKVPQKYFDAYYENVEAAVREKNGVLSDRKYTEVFSHGAGADGYREKSR